MLINLKVLYTIPNILLSILLLYKIYTIFLKQEHRTENQLKQDVILMILCLVLLIMNCLPFNNESIDIVKTIMYVVIFLNTVIIVGIDIYSKNFKK